MQIKRLALAQRDAALKLVLTTFMQYEAPDYSQKGIAAFRSCVVYNEDFLSRLVLYGAYEKSHLRGVIATRNHGNHIALFFVDGRYHRQGIGKNLFHAVLENASSNEITVNSSPYAVEIYHRLGFAATGAEQETDGLRYTPMKYVKGVGCSVPQL